MHRPFRIPLVAVVVLTICLIASAQDKKNDKKSPMTTAQRQALLKTFNEEFVTITPGKGQFPATFVMGSDKGAASEKPARTVRLTNGFSIAKYEVPQNLWEAVMGKNPSKRTGPRNSVEML